MKLSKQHKTFKIIIMAFFLIFGLVLSSNAGNANMEGVWNLKVVTSNGSGTPVFTLKQEGQSLSGTYKGKFGESPVEGKVTGNTFEINYDSSGVPVKYTGTVDGKNVKGDVDYSSYGTGTFTGSKE